MPKVLTGKQRDQAIRYLMMGYAGVFIGSHRDDDELVPAYADWQIEDVLRRLEQDAAASCPEAAGSIPST